MKRWNVFFTPDDGVTGAVPAEPATEPTATPEVQEVAKYTDKQLNDLIAKNSAKAAEKARAELLGSIGVNDESEIEALKKAREAQMTEAEKLRAELDVLKGADGEAKKAADAIRAENAALKKGVPADKVDRVVKLSAGYDGESVDERVAAVLEEFPEFVKVPVRDIGAPAHGQTQNEADALLEKARAQLGLKKA
jgi:uncharacterized protein CbrC (UPF0167 family)